MDLLFTDPALRGGSVMVLLTIFFSAEVVGIHLVQNLRVSLRKKTHHNTETMPPNRKALGVDAKCSVLLSCLRPSASIDQRFPNKVAGQRLTDLVAVRMGEVTRNGNKCLACFFKSESFPDVELYAAKRYVKVVEEGPSDLFFNVAPPSPATPQGEVATEENEGTEFDFR